MDLQPLGDRLIVEVLEEEEMTISGIVLQDRGQGGVRGSADPARVRRAGQGRPHEEQGQARARRLEVLSSSRRY